MAYSDNKKKIAELEALRDKLNEARRRKDYDIAVEACQQILALGKQAKYLNIMSCLYYKDMGEMHLKLLEYEKAHECFKTAYDGLVEFRATQKLKFPEDWLNELKVIERLIQKVEKTHLK